MGARALLKGEMPRGDALDPDKDVLTVSLEGFDQPQLDFLEKLDRLVSQHCQAAFKASAKRGRLPALVN